MSSLLEQAIVDANALKEAALRNAENLVVEKYAREVKSTMYNLLEQEEVTVGMQEPNDESEKQELNAIAEQLPDAFLAGEQEKVVIDLDELDSHINEALQLQEREKRTLTGDFTMNAEVSEEDISEVEEGAHDVDEAITLEEFESIISELADESEVGVPPDQSDSEESDLVQPSPEEVRGLANAVADDVAPSELEEELGDFDIADEALYEGDEFSEDQDLELEESEELEEHLDPEDLNENIEKLAVAILKNEEVENLTKQISKLDKENKTLKESAKSVIEDNKKLKEALKYFQKKIEDVNVSNAKLLYINQTLESVSLNERQKQNIVEAISKSGSVKEAKIIFETLKSSASGFKQEKSPGTLSEAVTSKSSLLIAARQESKKNEASSPFFDRMQKLAGLKQT